MITPKPCGCQAEISEVTRQVNLALLEERRARWDRLDDIALTLKKLTGVTTRILQRLEESLGLPKGQPLPIAQSNPVQNQLYASGQSTINGIARGFLLMGPGNLSLWRMNPNLLGGKLLLTTVPSAGVAVLVPFPCPVATGDTFAIATDSASGTGLISMTTWLEPVGLAGQQFYQLNNR